MIHCGWVFHISLGLWAHCVTNIKYCIVFSDPLLGGCSIFHWVFMAHLGGEYSVLQYLK